MQVGAIVPFNYPFHNIFNPLMAAVFAGNGIVIKVLPASACSISRQHYEGAHESNECHTGAHHSCSGCTGNHA